MEVIYEFPAYTDEIIKTLKRHDWFVHSFNTDNVYNPAGYVYASEFDGIEYQFHTDLNIYQYIISAYKKKNKSQLHRDAIALVVFAKITNIQFEPNLSIYEKINYSEQCSDTIIDDLFLFKKIDNADRDELAKFALGLKNDFKIPSLYFKDREEKKAQLVKYKRLKDWDSIYLHVLKICDIEQTKNLSNEDKINLYLDWCYHDFLHSISALCLAIKIWGKKPHGKIIKYQASQSLEKRNNALINMTWDLFLLHDFFKNWGRKEDKKEAIYVSNDKAFREILKMAISLQKSGDAFSFKDQISDNIRNRINSVLYPLPEDRNRKIDSLNDFESHRKYLIETYADKLLSTKQ